MYISAYKTVAKFNMCMTPVSNAATYTWSIGTYWIPVAPDNIWCKYFNQKASTSAHNAINNVVPFRGECAGAAEICLFLAADNVLGSTAFDAVHSAGSLGIDGGGYDIALNLAPITDIVTFVPGDYVYMMNKIDYYDYAPNGFWRGENCIYMGLNATDDGTFSGLGGQETNRKTETELRNILKNHYEQDCAPHTVTNPVDEIKFTDYYRAITGD